jgi:hypothetical protein
MEKRKPGNGSLPSDPQGGLSLLCIISSTSEGRASKISARIFLAVSSSWRLGFTVGLGALGLRRYGPSHEKASQVVWLASSSEMLLPCLAQLPYVIESQRIFCNTQYNLSPRMPAFAYLMCSPCFSEWKHGCHYRLDMPLIDDRRNLGGFLSIGFGNQPLCTNATGFCFAFRNVRSRGDKRPSGFNTSQDPSKVSSPTVSRTTSTPCTTSSNRWAL